MIIAILRIMAISASAVLLGLSPRTMVAADREVDAAGGDDRNPGMSVESPWRSLDRVNDAELKAGDRVLFKQGGVWRGSLHLRRGAADAPIVYTSYGDAAAQPMLCQAVSLSDPKDWLPAGENLWKTRPDAIDTAGRLWYSADHPPMPDALQTLTHLLVLLSRDDLAFSEVLDQEAPVV